MLERVENEDVLPCLKFEVRRWRFQKELLRSIKNQQLEIQALEKEIPRVCGLCLIDRVCGWQFKKDAKDNYLPICVYCRGKMVAVCNFYSFLKVRRTYYFSFSSNFHQEHAKRYQV